MKMFGYKTTLLHYKELLQVIEDCLVDKRRFQWCGNVSQSGEIQTAYRILVGSLRK